MSRKARLNQTAVASFTLVARPPMLTTEVFAKLGAFFVANPGKDPTDRATLDPEPCPHCQSKVEWALTAKVNPLAKGGLDRYVFARCKANGAAHRWAFKDAPKEAPSKPAGAFKCKVCPETFYTADAHKAHAESAHGIEVVLPSNPTPKAQPAVIQPPTPKPAAKEATMSNNPFAAFEEWINEKVGDRVTAAEAKLAGLKPGMSEEDVQAMIDLADPSAKIKAMIDDIVGSMKIVKIEVPSMPKVSFEGKAHPMLAVILKYIAAGERFFLLVGPASTGKSTLAGQVAEALKVDHYTALAVTATLQREDLLGCRAHNLTSGTVSYRGTPIVEAWEKDGVICLDEVDRGDANTLCCLNSIEQGCLYVPRAHDEGGPVARSSKAIVVATANTYGTGANRTYAGANQLDAAFLDRWRVIEVGYDRDLEIAVCGGDETAKACVDFLTKARAKADAASVRRPLTTRFARRVATDMRLSSTPLMVAEAMRAEAKGWTPTERSTVFG